MFHRGNALTGLPSHQVLTEFQGPLLLMGWQLWPWYTLHYSMKIRLIKLMTNQFRKSVNLFFFFLSRTLRKRKIIFKASWNLILFIYLDWLISWWILFIDTTHIKIVKSSISSFPQFKHTHFNIDITNKPQGTTCTFKFTPIKLFLQTKPLGNQKFPS